MKQQHQLIECLRIVCSFLVVGSHVASCIDSGSFPAANAVNDSIGAILVYAFRCSAVYFFLISGFILAAKLPEWRKAPDGLFFHMAKRITRLMFVFWAALLLVTLLNLLKQWLQPPAWVPFRRDAWLAEFFLASSASGQDLRMIPPAWYLEIDLLLIMGTSAVYLLWCDLPTRWKTRLMPLVALGCIAVSLVSLRVESLFMVEAHPSFAFMRSIGYFILGILAWHARVRLLPLLCLVVISICFIAFNDHTEMRKYHCTTASVILAWLLACSHHHPMLKQLFEKHPLKRLSKISYGLFLTHYLVLTVWISLARHLTPNSVPGFCCFMVLSLPAMYLVAWLFHHYVETNVLLVHRRLWSVKPAPARDTLRTNGLVPVSQAT